VPGLVPKRLANGEYPEDRKAFYATYEQRTPSTRLGTPQDVAAMVRFLLSEDAAWMNGQCIGVDGGLMLR
jgi:3-oxoacyl-[acyl-carrier protein] reductase